MNVPPQALPRKTTGLEYPRLTSSSPRSSPNTSLNPLLTTRPGEMILCAEYNFILVQTCSKCYHLSHKPSFNNWRWKWANISSQAQVKELPLYLVFWLLDWKTLVLVCLVRSVCSVSLPARKSCGIVDCFLPQIWPASLHIAPTSADLPFFCYPPPPSPLSRLDNDGIELLMSFLKVSISKSQLWRDAFNRCLDRLNGQELSLTSFCSQFQYESKKRVSADEAMRQSYFRSLGPRVHTLPESE